MQKRLKGEKYIYLLMGYTLAKQNGGRVVVGYDSGYKGGEHYFRTFEIVSYKKSLLLIESKENASCARFARTYLIIPRVESEIVDVYEYIENGENYSTRWTH